MRGRTLLASTTLALLTVVWSAPAALAAPNDSDEPQPPSSTAPARTTTPQRIAPQQGGGESEQPKPKPAPVQEPRTTETPKPTVQPKPTTESPKPTSEQPKPLPAPAQSKTTQAPSSAPAIAIAEPKATLTVSPKTVKQGESVTVNARCENGQVSSLSAPDVSFSGNSGRVAADASVGARTVTLVCVNGNKRSNATDSFEIIARDGVPGGDPRAALAVWPKTVRPGDTIQANPRCENGQVGSLSAPDVSFGGNTGLVSRNARDGDRTVTLTCVNGSKRATATDTFRVSRDGFPGGGNAKAYLAVSPKVVRQGDAIYANGDCVESFQVALFADGVNFSGNRGWVDDNAREGDHTVTRICRGGTKEDRATDTFRVVRGDGWWNGDGPRGLWLSDRSGDRGDSVDVTVRCRDDRARLESTAFDDITLHRDGPRLVGTTHVQHDASRGWHKVTVSCDGHSDSTGFWVNRDHGDRDRYLTLKPGYGHRGDSIDVYVGCDSSLGRLDSDVLDDIDLDHDGSPWRYSGTTHVQDNADTGEHTVKIRCGDETLEEDFFVRGDDGGGGGSGGGGGGDNGQPEGGDFVTVYPQGGVETGGGPVNTPAGVVALGLTGLTGASMSGIGSALGRRGERR